MCLRTRPWRLSNRKWGISDRTKQEIVIFRFSKRNDSFIEKRNATLRYRDNFRRPWLESNDKFCIHWAVTRSYPRTCEALLSSVRTVISKTKVTSVYRQVFGSRESAALYWETKQSYRRGHVLMGLRLRSYDFEVNVAQIPARDRKSRFRQLPPAARHPHCRSASRIVHSYFPSKAKKTQYRTVY